MCPINDDIVERLKKKASQSVCRFKVSAIAFDKRGAVLGISMNFPRFPRIGGGIHAEMVLMRTLKGIRTILICRIGQGGDILPIHPCKACKRKADELGIKILSIGEA